MKMTSVNLFNMTLVFLIGLGVNHAYPSLQDWPEECKGQTICHKQPSYYPKDRFAELLKGQKFNFVQGGSITNRSSEGDVADCKPRNTFGRVYLILDKNGLIRFVAQYENAYTLEVEVEECQKPGPTDSSVLDEDALKDNPVNCFETRVPFKFPVLKLDFSGLEAVVPKDGLSVSCSAKVMENN